MTLLALLLLFAVAQRMVVCSGGSDSESDSDWFSPVKSAQPYRITESTSQQPPRVFFPSDDPAVGIMDPHGASFVETPAPTTRVPQRRRKAWHKALWKLMSIGIYRNILGGTRASALSFVSPCVLMADSSCTELATQR